MGLAIKRFCASAVAALMVAVGFACVPAHAQIVYVVGTEWHTGLVVPSAEVDALARIPERDAFPAAQFLEFGWGDRDYYPNPKPTISTALGAAFASSASVMHLAGYAVPPAQRYPDAEIVALALDRDTFARLIAAIDASFDRGGSARAASVAPGLYRDSLFYPANGRFSIANTCNTWTLRMLETAGLPVSASGVVTATDALDRVRHPAPGGYAPAARP